MMVSLRPPRFPWGHFPDVEIHAEERAVKFHLAYHAAKTGDAVAAAGRLASVTTLTGKPYSAKLAPDDMQLIELREKHESLEPWWEAKFGHRFDCLTQSEARYLARTPDADSIRNRLAAAEQA